MVHFRQFSEFFIYFHNENDQFCNKNLFFCQIAFFEHYFLLSNPIKQYEVLEKQLKTETKDKLEFEKLLEDEIKQKQQLEVSCWSLALFFY